MEETRPDKANSTSLYIIGLIVLIAVGAGAYFIFQDTKDTNLEDSNMENSDEVIVEENQNNDEMVEEEAMDTETKNSEEASANELQNRIIIYRSYVVEIKPVLSDEALAALEVVTNFVDQDTSVLMNNMSTYPQEIQDAINTVKTEANQKLGTLAVKHQMVANTDEAMAMEEEGETGSNMIEPEESTISDDRIGKVVSGRGLLEVHETEEENPFGTVYMLTNEEDGNTYYFLFGNAKQAQVNDLVGQLVDIEVKITEIDDENNLVAYDVVSGPTLVEDEMENTEE